MLFGTWAELVTVFFVLFSRSSALSGAGSSAEAKVAIGTGLRVSFLYRKWTWALQYFLQSWSRLVMFGLLFYWKRISEPRDAIFFLFFLLKLLFWWGLGSRGALYFQIISLPVAKDSETKNHNWFWPEVTLLSGHLIGVCRVTQGERWQVLSHIVPFWSNDRHLYPQAKKELPSG